jgi:hypothetical protein
MPRRVILSVAKDLGDGKPRARYGLGFWAVLTARILRYAQDDTTGPDTSRSILFAGEDFQNTL